jgi:hypothetical protein
MRRMMILLLFFCVQMHAQKAGEEEPVLRVLGIMQMEEADEESVERLTYLLRHPLRINSSGRRELEAAGLFTPFQIASLLDYRERHGDIMSLAELSSVDGFTSQTAGRLEGFLSFDPFSLVRKTRQVFKGEVNARSSLKFTEGESLEWKYALKGKMSFSDVLGVSFSAFSRSVSVVWNHGRGSLILGDHNSRFGQGLCLWNTATIGGLLAPSSYMRRASGISQAYSFSGSYAMSGLAGNLSLGRWCLSGSLHLPGLKSLDFTGLCPSLNLTRYLRIGHVGLTAYAAVSDMYSRYFRIPQMRISTDASFCFRGVNVFGEGMYDMVAGEPAAVLGFETPAGEYTTVASLVRFLPLSDEHGWAASVESKMKHHSLLISADAIYHPSGKSLSEGRAVQLKGQARWKWDVSDRISAEVRMTERFRTWGTAFRTDARVDLLADVGLLQISSRFNALICKDVGLLGYVEVQYKTASGLKAYLRQGIFRIDNWDDRIYVYERDAPGNFNVPAYYGRGIWTSGYVSWRFAGWGSLYVRSSYVSYPMMREKKKPGKAELKLQYVVKF